MKHFKLLTAIVLAGLSAPLVGTCNVSAEDSLSEVVVNADKDHVRGNEDVIKPLGIVADEVQNEGLLGKQDAMSTPFSSMTLTRKSTDYFASPATSLSDVVSLNPAVRNSSSAMYNDISIRGFRINGHQFYVNGVPGLLDQQHSTDIFVDKITVIAGPNLGIEGTPISQSVGGTVDIQTKKAQDKGNTDINFTYRGGESFQEALDFGKRFGDNNRWGVRIMASNIDGDTVVDGENLKQRDVFVNIDQKTTNSKSNLFVGYDYVDQHGALSSFSFADGVTSLPKAPKASGYYKPDWSYQEYDSWVAAFNHEQKLNEHVTAFFNAGYHREDWYGYIDSSPKVLDDTGRFSIGLTNYPLALTKKYAALGIKGEFDWGSTKHNYVINVDRNWYNYWLSSDPTFGKINGQSGSTYTVYGNLNGGNSWLNPILTHTHAAHSQDIYMNGWHIMDNVSLLDDRMNIIVGVHGHDATQTKYDTSSGKQTSRKSYDGVIPTYAVNYKFTPNFSAYFSHSENFNLGTIVPTNRGYKNAGEGLDPNKAKQNEIGVKYKAGNLLHTLSLYEIKQANYAATPDNYYKEYGKQKDKGFEYSVAGAVNDKLDIIGGFTYMDAKQTLDDQRVSGAPHWSGTMGLVYKVNQSLHLIGRAQYFGRAPIKSSGGKEKYTVPSHTIFDFGASYETKIHETPVTLNAMLYNAFGKDYWLATAGQDSVHLGAPRTFVFSATLHL